MPRSALAPCVCIAKTQLRRNIAPRLAMAGMLALLAPVLFGTVALDARAVAIPLEMVIAPSGIVLFPSVFRPEERKEIREVVEAKATNPLVVHIIRLALAILAMLLLILGFLLYLRWNGCHFPFYPYLWGTAAGGLLLGSLAVLTGGLGGNEAVGYMLPMSFYMANLLCKPEQLGPMYLFSMSQGSYTEKYVLALTGGMLIFLTLAVASIVRRKR